MNFKVIEHEKVALFTSKNNVFLKVTMDSVLSVKEKAIQGMIKVVLLLIDSNCFTFGCLQTNT